MTILEEYWLLILLALIAAIAIAWYVFHAARRTRVEGDGGDVLDDGAARAARNQALIDAAPAAATASAKPAAAPAKPEPASAKPAAAAPPAAPAAASGDLQRLKGVGPKLVEQLGALGVTSLAQVASWDDGDIDRYDGQLGRFQGRIRRDSWVEQAKLLAAGDEAGHARKFGAGA